MYKGIALALLIVGAALVFYGIHASQSLGSDISRFFTNTPTDKTIWLMIGGIVLSIVGLTGLMRGSKDK